MNKLFKTSLVLLTLDVIFLYLIKEHFTKQIELVQKSKIIINFYGAILSYLFVILTLYYFIIKDNRSKFDAFILGMCIYGVYEYTTFALLKDWLIETTIIDTLWGGILFMLTTMILKKI